jgi:hypothetical protein
VDRIGLPGRRCNGLVWVRSGFWPILRINPKPNTTLLSTNPCSHYWLAQGKLSVDSANSEIF